MENKEQPFQLSVNGRQIALLPEQMRTIDAIVTGENRWHVLENEGKRYTAECISANFDTKQLVFKINGNVYNVSIADRYDQLVEMMGLNKVAVNKIRQIKAPMPGLVLDVAVVPGQTLQTGDKVLILEAMKMENVLKSAGEGTVKTILVEKGAAVVKGQVLIELD